VHETIDTTSCCIGYMAALHRHSDIEADRPADSHRHVQTVDPRNALILLRRLQNFVFVRALLSPLRPSSSTQHHMYMSQQTEANDFDSRSSSRRLNISISVNTCFKDSCVNALKLTVFTAVSGKRGEGNFFPFYSTYFKDSNGYT